MIPDELVIPDEKKNDLKEYTTNSNDEGSTE